MNTRPTTLGREAEKQPALAVGCAGVQLRLRKDLITCLEQLNEQRVHRTRGGKAAMNFGLEPMTCDDPSMALCNKVGPFGRRTGRSRCLPSTASKQIWFATMSLLKIRHALPRMKETVKTSPMLALPICAPRAASASA